LKQFREAAPLLERLVRDYPQRATVDSVLYEWGWALTDLERIDEADAVFTRLYLEHPNSDYWGDATFRLAERAAAKKDFDRATKLAREVIDKRPGGPVEAHCLFLLGKTAIRQGHWDSVLSSLGQLCERFPDSTLRPAAEFWMAEATYRSGKLDEAKQQLDRLAETRAADGDKWLPMVELRRAQVLVRQKQWFDALDRASHIAELFPDFERQYEVDYLTGRCLASLGRFREARAAYERVIQSKTGRDTETAAMAQWMIGETFFHQRDFDQAKRAYARVDILWNYPRWNAAALLQAGKCHEARGQLQPAATCYTELTTKYPDTKFAQEGERRLSVVRQRSATRPPNVPRTGSATNRRDRT
jgi:TolA-binding protein